MPVAVPAASALRRVIGGLAEEERLAVTAPAIVDGQRLARIDADPDFGCWMVGVFPGLRENVDNQLAHRDRADVHGSLRRHRASRPLNAGADCGNRRIWRPRAA